MVVADYPYISRLRVKNFRSIGDLDLHLDRLTVLVGTNASGKSNIVDVLRFVRDALTKGLDVAVSNRGIECVRCRFPDDELRNIDIGIDLTSRPGIIDYRFVVEPLGAGQYRVKEESLFRHSHNSRAEIPTWKIIDGKFTDFPSSSDSRLYSIDQLKNTHDDGVLKLPDAVRFFRSGPANEGELWEIFGTLRDMGFYEIYPRELRNPQKASDPEPLEERGENLASFLKRMKKGDREVSVREITDALSIAIDGITGFSVEGLGSYLLTMIHHSAPSPDAEGPKFDLGMESDGTIRLLGLISALYQDPPRSLIGIEEPELTVHPGAMAVLWDEINAASYRQQMLLTTHSPDLLDLVPVEHIRVVKKTAGVTDAGPIEDRQRQIIREELFTPGELMRIEGFEREPSREPEPRECLA